MNSCKISAHYTVHPGFAVGTPVEGSWPHGIGVEVLAFSALVAVSALMAD